MIKLCKNLRYKPKYCSDADSIMMKHLVSTVTIILVCLAALSFSAYAFFSHSVTSANNTIQTGNFSSTVTVKDANGETITEGKINSYAFAPGQYTVTINKDAATNGTGFCIIQIDGVKYYTQQLGNDLNAPNGERTEISFKLDLQATTTVSFESRWGTTSYYSSAVESEFYIKNTDPLTVIQAAGTENASDTPAETQPSETSPSTDAEETTVPEEATVPEETTSPAEVNEVTHIVENEETLSGIAVKYGMSHTRIAAYNQIPAPYVIRVGQEIHIPPEDWVEPTVPTEVTE